MTETVTPTLDRSMLARAFPDQPALVIAFSEQSEVVEQTALATDANSQQAETQQSAPVLCYAASGTFTNERVLRAGDGVSFANDGTFVTVSIGNVPRISGGNEVTFVTTGPTNVTLPPVGRIATTDRPETLQQKTVEKPLLSSWGNYPDDAAAAAGGVPVGGVYRNGSSVMVRVS